MFGQSINYQDSLHSCSCLFIELPYLTILCFAVIVKYPFVGVWLLARLAYLTKIVIKIF